MRVYDLEELITIFKNCSDETEKFIVITYLIDLSRDFAELAFNCQNIKICFDCGLIDEVNFVHAHHYSLNKVKFL